MDTLFNSHHSGCIAQLVSLMNSCICCNKSLNFFSVPSEKEKQKKKHIRVDSQNQEIDKGIQI